MLVLAAAGRRDAALQQLQRRFELLSAQRCASSEPRRFSVFSISDFSLAKFCEGIVPIERQTSDTRRPKGANASRQGVNTKRRAR